MALRRVGRWVAVSLAAAYLLLGLGVPLVITLCRSVDIQPFWEAFTAQLGSSSTLIILERTLVLALAATAITTVIGYPVAYAMTLMRPRVRAVFLALLVFPYLTSLLVRSYAWIGILGVNGPVIEVVRWFGDGPDTFDNTAVGVLAVLVHVLLPVVVLTCYVTMSRIDPSHLRAARTLGANHLESFWRVYAPQTKTGALSGAVLVFIISAGMYATPALIGGPAQTTVASLVVQQVTQGTYGLSPAYPAALTVVLAVVVGLVLALTARWVGLGEVLGLKSTRGPAGPRGSRSREERSDRPRLRPFSAVVRRVSLPSGHHHVFVRAMVVLAVLLIDGPFVFLLGMSFQPLPLLAFPTTTWSAKWYASVFEDSSWGDAIAESAKIAVLATVIALIAGSFLALRTAKLRAVAATSIVASALLPLIVPAIMYATGIFTVFTGLDLIGDWRAIAVVHSVLALPYVYVNVLNGLNSYDPRWDQAACSLGASPLRRLRKITLPLLRPALVTGAFLAALLSLDEFTVTLFMGGLTFENLPLKFWSGAQENLSPELAAVGVLLTGFIIVIAAVALLGSHVARRANSIRRSAS